LKALKEGKVTSDEYEIHADSKRGLGMYTKEELLDYINKKQWIFYLRPKYFFNLLKKSIIKNDFSILNMILSIYFSNLKENVNPFNSFLKQDH
jgi:hypothetical protein